MTETDLPGLLSAAAEGIAALDPGLLALVAAPVALSVIVKGARSGMNHPKDPVRDFSAAQRSAGFTRAAGRCELDGSFWFTRCKRPASHGDHHFPHSKGGASSMENFVAACVRCNTSTGAKIPGLMATMRIERRRRKYFPAGISVKAGAKYRQR